MGHDALLAGVEDWLLDQALRDVDVATLFAALCERLRAIGLPLDRAMLSWPTLHPVWHSEQLVWTPGAAPELSRFGHEMGVSTQFVASPMHHMLTLGLPSLRRRIEGPGAVLDFPVLRELQAAGFTDYLTALSDFSLTGARGYGGLKAVGLAGSWATRRPGGFEDADIAALGRLLRLYAVAVRASLLTRIMENLCAAYLGPSTARRVMAGAIRRGDGERIRALVWFSDLRGSTRAAQDLSAEDYLALLNRFYAVAAQPVLDAGGEVLDFLGDGVLGVFPLGEAPDAVIRAAAAAADVAVAANAAGPALDFGVGLTVGEVMYGNVGVPERLNFTAIGPAVNAVTRVERHTRRAGRPVLATADVAAAEPGRWDALGPVALDGLPEPLALFARR
jgi:adenylate cyclase